MALAQFDRGAAPFDLPMERMQLVLTRSPQQETALRALLDAQHDNSSASFHKWLTPEEFGQQFGPADQDVQVVTSWLQSHGFQVNRVANGRTAIEFSGTAELVRNTFQTEIHKYVVNGEEHWANASDPQIPEALAPVVAGVATLHNFRAKPLVRISDIWPKVPMQGGRYRPAYNSSNGRALAPGDFATIYNVNPLYRAGINGSGVTIGVLGVAPILPQDIADFRQAFDLPKNPPQVVVNGTAPDYWQQELEVFGPDTEGTLDLSWAGAVAPNATVKFIVSADTDTTDGLALSEEYAVDNNVADILTESFSRCESDMTAAFTLVINALREQAAAQGITWMVSTGDSGPYLCYGENGSSSLGPLTVNVLASSPYVVAVGGTEFTSASVIGTTYWSVTNNAKTLASAISYPPEDVWNDSCSATKCGADNVYIAASSGGASRLFTKPSWQSGVAGIPSDQARDIPDVSLTASAVNAPYLICLAGACEGTITSSSFMPIGGTSASAPSFAGIMALVNQKMKSRQGVANYVLYSLAASEQYSGCNGSSTSKPPASNCIFNDITSGDSSVPGEPNYGEPGAKYPAGTGYDLATGLGSVNAANLVNNWGSVSFHATSTALALNPGTLTHGTPASVQVSVAPQSGSGTPTGDVSLVSAGTGYGFFPLIDGSVASTLASLPGGTYTLHAHYSGDGAFAPSDSAAVPVTVTPEASTTTAAALWTLGVANAFYTGGPYGNQSVGISARVAGRSGQGTATGKVTFTDNGNAFSGNYATLNSEAQAISFNTNIVFPVGQHSVVATYAGDASFQPSFSPPVNITITQAHTTVSIQPTVNQVESGKPVILTATIEAGDAQYGDPETGTVTFFLNGAPLGTRAVTPNFDFGTGLFDAIALFNTSSLPQGTNSITATYSGDSNYVGSASAPVAVTVVKQAPAPACLVTNFTADPNPVTLYDPPGTTMINVTAPCQFDIRTGSPSGTLVGSGKGTSLQVAELTGATTTFYLQEAGNTKAQGTLQTLTVVQQSGALPCIVDSFSATPSPIVSPTLMGTTTITATVFTAAAPCNFDIRVGAPNGNLFGSGQGVLAQTANDWVTNGTQFFLQQQGNTTAQGTLATLTVPVIASAPLCVVTNFSANPNPIPASGGGITTIEVNAACAYDIRLNSPGGSLFATGAGALSAPTGPWVTNGMMFYLQLQGNATPQGTLATLTVTVQ